MERDKIAYATDTPERCRKVAHRLRKENVRPGTMKWLKNGDCRYKYVIFEFDEWVGFYSLDNIYEDKRIVTTVVNGMFVEELQTKWIDRKLNKIELC